MRKSGKEMEEREKEGIGESAIEDEMLRVRGIPYTLLCYLQGLVGETAS